MMRILLILAALMVASHARASEIYHIGFEFPIDEAFASAAEDYWRRNPDVEADPIYGRAGGALGAKHHYENHGQYEGRYYRIGALLTSCFEEIGSWRIKNGFNCLHFPAGGRITGISWNSAGKTFEQEILSQILLTPFGDITDPDIRSLLVTYQGGQMSTMANRDPHINPIDIPPGWYVWIYAEGWGPRHPAGFEVQLMLYVEPLVTQ